MDYTQQVDLYQPITSRLTGTPPLYLRVYVNRQDGMSPDGIPVKNVKLEPYILLSALPKELQARIDTAIQALQAGQ